jgi:hypothetical protein
MSEINMYSMLMAQVANDVVLQARIANSAFITNMSGSMAVHSRCGQVMDKRIAEYDIEEVRAVTSVDPATQSYLLSKAGLDAGQVAMSTSTLIEVLRQVQGGKK